MIRGLFLTISACLVKLAVPSASEFIQCHAIFGDTEYSMLLNIRLRVLQHSGEVIPLHFPLLNYKKLGMVMPPSQPPQRRVAVAMADTHETSSL